MAGATIRIFLVDGTPLGPKIIEKSAWDGRAFEFARVDWTKMRDRDDFSRPGVYVLRGLGEDGQARVYVGEADVLRTRINQHDAGPASRDFWDRAIAFVGKGDGLNKAHVRYLESRLVSIGLKVKRAKLENANAPAPPALAEYDRSDADAFLEEVLVVCPLVGVDAFAAPPAPKTEGRLHLKGKGASAEGREESAGFVVYEGGIAAKDETASLATYARKLRKDLADAGVLVPDGDMLRLAQTYVFKSPTMAAVTMLGRPANGRTEWKDKSGKTLKEIQAAKAAG